MELQIAGICHIGTIRDGNEDNIMVNGAYRDDTTQDIKALEDCWRRPWNICGVFDGMGGESHGDAASLKAAEIFSTWQPSFDTADIEDLFLRASDDIYDSIPKFSGQRAGTTAAVFISDGRHAAVCNIGDSRIYRYRQGELKQLSKDHTSAQQLVDMGMDNGDDVAAKAKKGSITQYLGVPRDEFQIEPFICRDLDLEKDDIYLLCSDGLTDMLEDEEIRDTIAGCSGRSARLTVAAAVQKALDKGGRDNVSVIAVRVL